MENKHRLETFKFKTIDSAEELKTINGGTSIKEIIVNLFGGKKDKDNNNG